MIRYVIINFLFFLLCSSAQSQELVVKEKNGLYGFFENKTMVVDFQFDSVDQQFDGFYAVRKAGKWGLISPDGRESIPCKYDLLNCMFHPLYKASFNGMMGILDTAGVVILDFVYDEIDHVDKDTQALVNYQGKWCLYKNGVYLNDDDIIFHAPDTLPFFPGCQKGLGTYAELRNCAEVKMYKYISNNINYPPAARRKGIQGAVIVLFTVTREGKLEDPIILRSLGGGCDEEVLGVIKGMPAWIPAVKDGKSVASKFVLPVKFVLSR